MWHEHIQSGSFLKKRKKKIRNWNGYSRNGIGIYLKALITQFHPWNSEFVPFCHLSKFVFFYVRFSVSQFVAGISLVRASLNKNCRDKYLGGWSWTELRDKVNYFFKSLIVMATNSPIPNSNWILAQIHFTICKRCLLRLAFLILATTKKKKKKG